MKPAALRPPHGAVAEVTARRAWNAKMWARWDGQVMHRFSTTPLHYWRAGAWHECDPRWVGGRITALPYQVRLLPPSEIGFELTAADGSVTTVRLLKLDGAPVLTPPQCHTYANRVWWSPVPGLTITLVAQTWGLQTFQELGDADAPRAFVWEVQEPSSGGRFAHGQPFGHDNLHHLARTPRPLRRRLDLTQQTEVLYDNGRTRIVHITETWTGRTVRFDPVVQCRVVEADVRYPVVFDPTFSQTISVGAEDGYETSGLWYGANTFLYLQPSTVVAIKHLPGVRFTNVTIDHTAVISLATLTVKVNNVNSGYPGDPDGDIYADAVDTAAAWSDTSRPLSGFTKTTNKVTQDFSTTGTKVVTLTPVAAEVLNRAGWVSGANLRFAMFPLGPNFSGAHLDSQETVAGAPAILDVTYAAAVTETLHAAMLM